MKSLWKKRVDKNEKRDLLNISSAPLIEDAKGSNLLQWRTQQALIRTVSIYTCQIKIPLIQANPIYKRFAPKIKELNALGMSNKSISVTLGIDQKTVKKGLVFKK